MTAPRYRTDRMLFIDLELTTDEPPPPGWKSEIIQLGVAELDTDTLEVGRTAAYLVRPKNWGGITPFCTQLTGISRDQVKANGRPWNEVVATFTRAFGPGAKTVIGWGRDDLDIAVACEEYGVENPVTNYVNIAVLFRMLIGNPRTTRMGLEDAMRVLGLEWPGRQHDALVDATATAMVWREMCVKMRAGMPSAEVE